MARTTALNKIEAMLYEPTFYKVIQGGASAGKTFAILTLLVGYAESYSESLITVVGLSYPHLDAGSIRDFKKIMKETNRWDEDRWNKSAKTYSFPNGSVIEFKSLDHMSARGPRRDVLFVNEANGVDWETFQELATRTKDFVIIDYNPSAKFWAHERLVEGLPEDTTFLVLTYLDNEALSAREVANIESHKPKEGEEPSNWWIVYGLGQIGSLEGNIYSGWEENSLAIAMHGRLVRYGLDFGFSNDETALVAVYELEDGRTGVVEKIYQKGILGSQYPEILKSHNIDPSVLIVADAARPEIIAEIKNAGFRCIGADKNAGSVKRGIDRVQQRQIVYYGGNLNREYLSYAWRKKRSGEVLDEPQDGNDHCLPFSTKVDTTQGQRMIGELVGTSGWVFCEGGVIRFYRNVRQTGVEKILKITLADGRVLRCSSEHPIYTVNRGIVPASLLNTEDMIQSVIYETTRSRGHQRQKTKIQWQELLARCIERLLSKRTIQASCVASGGVGVLQRKDTSRASYRSHRQEQRQQSDNKPASRITLGKRQERVSGNTKEKAAAHGRNTLGDESVACFGGREKMALGAWQACVSEERTRRKKLCALWEKVLYNTVLKGSALLFRNLQDESKNQTTDGASRGRKRGGARKALRNLWRRILLQSEEGSDLLAILSKQENVSVAIAKVEEDGIEPVYCMDVFDTSNFSVEGGLIVSNCLDALRYAIDDLDKPRFDF